MNKQILISIVFLSFIFTKITAQTVEPSKGVDKGILQMEFETLYSEENIHSEKNTSWNIPNILVRYGLSDNIELQLHTPFTKERCYENNRLTSNVFKFEEMEVGVSVNLWKQNKLIPEAAIMGRIVSLTENFSFNKLGHIVSLNMANQINDKLSLNYNIGTTTNIDKETTGFYVVNFTYDTGNIHYFIENTSDYTFDETASNCLGTGFGLNVKDNLGIDFSFSKSLKHNMFCAGAIITWVLNSR